MQGELSVSAFMFLWIELAIGFADPVMSSIGPLSFGVELRALDSSASGCKILGLKGFKLRASKLWTVAVQTLGI